MNILPQLSLNAHHQTTKTMSIVDANGIRLTKDCNALEVEMILEVLLKILNQIIQLLKV